jgi:lysozyme family protein
MQISLETFRQEYVDLFASLKIHPDKKSEVEATARQIALRSPRYLAVESATGVPWFVVGLIHAMEANLSFRTHLHNGDPLTARTVHVPRGRPVEGEPPFEWEASAIDALRYDHVDRWKEWSVAGVCFELEGYNGWGYRRYHIHSPYLWAGSNQYEKGKFVADGIWAADAVSDQVGAAVLLWQMCVNKDVALDGLPVLQNT